MRSLDELPTPVVVVDRARLERAARPHPQRDRFVAKLFVDNLGRFLDGAPLKEVVDRSAGY